MDKTLINIQITPEQANALVQIIDIAVKSGGLQLAQNAVFFHTLIQEAHKASQKAPEEDNTKVPA